MAQLTLEAWKDGGWHRFLVTFPDARMALAWAMRNRDRRVYLTDSEDYPVVPANFIGPLSADEEALLDYLHPTCHHGMSADLCMDPMGPNHFGTWEQELAGML